MAVVVGEVVAGEEARRIRARIARETLRYITLEGGV